MKKDNFAARDYWSQIYSRLANKDSAAIVDPDYDFSNDEGKLRVALLAAGWNSEEVDLRVEAARKILVSAGGEYPGILLSTQIQMNKICDIIECVMEKIGIGSHKHIVRGVEPSLGTTVSLTNVIMTEEGVVTVSAMFFRFCGLIARALTRSLLKNPFFWNEGEFNVERDVNFMKKDKELCFYWISIFISFYATGSHILTRFSPANKAEVLLFEQVAHSMELFAVAHEYGHHFYRHGRELGADPIVEELEADQFAIKVSHETKSISEIFIGPYMYSGAGGVIMLMSLEIIRKISLHFNKSNEIGIKTHPDLLDRLAQFDGISVLRPSEYKSLKSFRLASFRIISAAEQVVFGALKSMPDDLIYILKSSHDSLLRDPSR